MKRYISEAEKLSIYVDGQLKKLGKDQCLRKLAKHWNAGSSTVYRRLAAGNIENMRLKDMYILANVLEITPAQLIEGGKAL